METTTYNSSAVLDKISALEKIIYALKKEILLGYSDRANRLKLLKESFGILNKSYPSGIKYENNIRAKWEK